MGFFRRFFCCCCKKKKDVFLDEPLLYYNDEDVFELARRMTYYASGIPQRS
jgi:hypothetical protein